MNFECFGFFFKFKILANVDSHRYIQVFEKIDLAFSILISLCLRTLILLESNEDSTETSQGFKIFKKQKQKFSTKHTNCVAISRDERKKCLMLVLLTWTVQC